MPFNDNLPAENTDPWYAPFVMSWGNLKTFVNGLETALGGKSDVGHTHAAADVTSGTFTQTRIPDLNASKITSGTRATSSVPEVPISQTTGLQAALDGKASSTDLNNVFTIANAAIPASQKAAANGVATLGSDSKLPAAQLPDIAVTDYLGPSANQAAMLALAGQKGDWTTRTDLGTVWIITGNDPSVIGGWTQLTYPTAAVLSVAGRTGAVVLAKADVGLSNVDNTADSAKPVSTAQQTALDGKVPVTRTVAGKALSADVTLVKGDVGLGNVDNTADTAKPVSTAQQTALNLKANANAVVDLTTAQSVAGVKTFTDIPVVPVGSWPINRTTGLQAALDAKVGSPNTSVTGIAYYATAGDLPPVGTVGVIYVINAV